jgi:Secretion system C-terminal sorting domain
MQLKRFAPYFFTAIIFLQCKQHDKKEIISANEEMDGMEQAMLQEFFKTRDPLLNVIPNERLQTARTYMQTLLPAVGTARIMALTWQERGPNNIGGRTRAILIDKSDVSGNTVFAGSVSGGLFKCTNFTNAIPNWTVVNDFLPNLAITCIVQDNNNLNIMYAGTGEGWFNVDALRGAGIYKSIDGGTTWNQLSSTTGFDYVQDIVIDNNGNLYASLNFLSTNPNHGVVRSTNGGTTWTQVLGSPLAGFVTGRASDLEVAPNGDIYAALGIFSRAGLFKSSFATNGANTGAVGTWVNITPPWVRSRNRVELAIAPSNSQRLYVFAQDSTTDEVMGTYRSFNGGSTWDSVGSPDAINNGTNSQAWYDLIAAVDPNNPDILIAGGVNLGKSVDAGVNWTTIGSGAVHVDHHSLTYVGSSKLIDGNDGGIHYSTNIDVVSPSFTNKNNGYNVTQFYGCDYHPTDANYFLAGAQDNNTQKFTVPGINSTNPVVGGDGAIPHIRQTDGVLQIAATTANNYYRSLNSGANFSSLGSGINNDRGRFINPSDLDNSQNILYAGDDLGNYYVISNLNTTPSGSIKTITEMGTDRAVTAVKMDPAAANTIWLGASTVDESQTDLRPIVLKIANANTTPTVQVNSIMPTAVPAGAEISSIDVDPANTNNILVTISNYGAPSVWLSTNAGTSWTNIEGDLPDMPVHYGIFAPSNAQLNGSAGGNGGILLATELGVWTTSQINGASTQWIPNVSGFSNVSTFMLKYRASDNLLVAATHGRGLFTTTIPTVVTGLPNIPITKNFIKYISADNNQLQIVVGNLSTTTITIQLLDMNGRMVDRRKNPYQNLVMDLNRLSKGAYIVKITGDKKEKFVQQFVKK